MSHGERRSATPASALVVLLVIALAPFAGAAAATLPPLVTPDWLAEHRQRPGLVVLDVRSALDDGHQPPFSRAHIPGAVHSDYLEDGWRTTRGGVPGMRPAVGRLEALIGGLGIANNSAVVIVPAGTGPTDFGSATRVYWTFRTLGHDRVAILNGGFRGWQQAGRPVARGTVTPEPRSFRARPTDRYLATLDDVTAVIEGRRSRRLVDARPHAFFAGERKAWATDRAGTLPGAVSGEHSRLLRDGPDGVWMLTGETLRARLARSGLTDPSRPVTTFCTTGHWATINWFALHAVAGFEDARVYDGSMAEWTRDAERPVANGREGLGRLLDWIGL